MSRGRGVPRVTSVPEAFLWPADPAEDWHPCWPRHTVKVLVFGEYAGRWRVAAWGADDFGLERDFPSEEERRAFLGPCDMHLPNPLSKAWLRARGFIEV